MLQKLLKLIGTAPGEEKQVILLLGNGFFIGIFLGTYQLAADTLFTTTLKEHLNSAYLVQGVLGVISTFLFAYFQSRISYSKLAIFNLLNIFIFTTLALVLSKFYPNKYLVYLLFAMLGPIQALTLLGFWGVFGRIFDLRQSKRIIGRIDSGQLSGTILAFTGTIFLSQFKAFKDSTNLLFISTISLLIAIWFLIRIVNNFDLNIVKRKSKEEVEQTKLGKILKMRYVKLLSLFIIFSVVVFKFVDYSFLKVAPIQFPEPETLLSFFAVFNAAAMILSFLLQSFVTDKIILNYGLKMSLVILPVILLFFTLASILAGSFIDFSGVIDKTYFIYFFLFITLNKLFSVSIRDALENPAFKLFFLSLENKIRFDIQAKVEGVINQFGIFIAGGVLALFGLGTLLHLELVHYSYLLFFILLGMIYIVGKLYNEYRNSLKRKLEAQKAEMDQDFSESHEVVNILKNSIRSDEPKDIIFALLILEKLDPLLFESTIISLVSHSSELVREYALRKIDKAKLISAKYHIINLSKKEKKEPIKNLAAVVLKHLEDTDKMQLSNFQFFILVRSENPIDREFAAKILARYDSGEFEQFLLDLLKDVNPKVRSAALITAGKMKDDKLWPILIENLGLPGYSHASFSALVSLGDKVLDTLDKAFYKTGQSLSKLIQIVKIYGRIGTPSAINHLWNKINYPNKKVVNQTLFSLSACDFNASEDQVVTIKNYLNQYVGFIAWNIAAITEVPRDSNGERLKDALKKENETNYEILYLLLSMLFDKRSIELVRENIDSGTNDGITFALELLDVFLPDDLKPILFPVLDDISPGELAKRLQFHHPRSSYSTTEILKQIINRDYNSMNRWTKACALYSIALMDNAELSQELIANLFNPDAFLRETTAWAIYQIDPEGYHFHTRRLSNKLKKELDAVIIPKVDAEKNIQRQQIKFHRINYLKNKVTMFKSVSEVILVDLVDRMKVLKVAEGTVIVERGQITYAPLLVIAQGGVNVYRKDKFIGAMGERQLVGYVLSLQPFAEEISIVARANSHLYQLNREALFDDRQGYAKLYTDILPRMNTKFYETIEKHTNNEIEEMV
ncbi:HEAT repeat domain-containing protein [Fulvivirgaceae bacterium BMA10]|uniref:HEAT repeat domain-containing protein n=1 Tax=Splendidivirga corallicola TaxID=3051826 RepID=A0ABT8KWZ8_9BACT|nr:HEAT repeat domain-containing protein [Fulvivirgaceae bacterium BMA10]